ncbi:MAG: hypothetical protein MR430_05015 [Lachnospiraceae bacterium]|nr:hypothetical protein [Lachnospiraceae bacterium]
MSAVLTVFLENRLLSCAFVVFLFLSIVCQAAIGVMYRRIIKETDNMAATKNKLLKQCKMKFANCYQMNAGVPNIPVFVDKFLLKISVMGISLSGLQHLAGQFMLLAVATAGVAACREIIRGETVGRILPYYIAGFLGLYVYFSISGMVDVQSRRDRLKTNLVDYLENHMVNKLRQSAMDWEELTGETMVQAGERVREKSQALREEIGLTATRGDSGQDKEQAPGTSGKDREQGECTKGILTHQEEEELDELLRQFLA